MTRPAADALLATAKAKWGRDPPGHVLRAIESAGSHSIHCAQRVSMVAILYAHHLQPRARHIPIVCPELAQGHLQAHFYGCGPAQGAPELSACTVVSCWYAADEGIRGIGGAESHCR